MNGNIALSEHLNFGLYANDEDRLPVVTANFIGLNGIPSDIKSLLELEAERMVMLFEYQDTILTILGGEKADLYLNLFPSRPLCILHWTAKTPHCPDCPISKSGYDNCDGSPIEELEKIENAFTRNENISIDDYFMALDKAYEFIEQMG